jgi:hypothetical protein
MLHVRPSVEFFSATIEMSTLTWVKPITGKTPTPGGMGMVTAATADFVASAAEVAVIVTVAELFRAVLLNAV